MLNRIMASKKTVIKIIAQLFGPSIIFIPLLMVMSINSRLSITRSDFPNELDYYKSVDGYYIKSDYPWQNFSNLDGHFFQVSRQGLRKESFKVLNAIGDCVIFVDKVEGMIWITGLVKFQTEGGPTMFVYYWRFPGETLSLPDISPLTRNV